jgi:hypothetical protein
MNSRHKRWYLPGWGETARLFGWRWLLFLPAAALLAVAIAMPWNVLFHYWIMLIGRLFTFAITIPTVVFLISSKDTIQKRTDPFCIHCGYTLQGLPDHHTCPECGEPYNFAQVDEYRRDPHWFIKRYKREYESE